MSELLDNAVASIQLGVEDFQRTDDLRRLISAIRNFHAGVLLLCKVILRLLSPENSNEVHVKAKQKAFRGWFGIINWVGVGDKTVDEYNIRQRFKDLGVQIDLSKLEKLTKIRNQIEHYHAREPVSYMQEAFAAALPIVHEIIVKELDGEPVKLLGKECWSFISEQADIFEKEQERCKNTFNNIAWKSTAFETAYEQAELRCTQCGSTLLRQKDADNNDEEDIELVCTKCGALPVREDVIEAAMSEIFAYEYYLCMTDGNDEPINECPECGHNTYIIEEGRCVACGFILDSQECGVCGKELSVEDYANGSGLCSYHHAVMERERDR